MSSKSKKIDSTRKKELRSIGIKCLGSVLKLETNIKIIEKYINKKAKESDEYEGMYKKILYQTIGDIIKGDDLKSMLENIKNDLVGWKHPTFTDVKNRIEEHDDFIINPFEVEEGVTTCHCGSSRVFTYQRQTRSSDEPMTTFAQCVNCKATWTYSG
jgi:DNA-directed RNA polymerase subunit M/transcription elongation factor TFIIS